MHIRVREALRHLRGEDFSFLGTIKSVICTALMLISFTAEATVPLLHGWFAEGLFYIQRVPRPSYQAACSDAYEDAQLIYAAFGGVVFDQYVFSDADPEGQHNVRCVYRWGNARPYNDVYYAAYCPANSTRTPSGEACECKDSYQEDGSGASCVKATPKAPPAMCMAGALVGKPIAPGTGEEVLTEFDVGAGGASSLSFVRHYRSGWTGDAARTSSSMGPSWTHSFLTTLKALPANSPVGADITLPDGAVQSFSRTGGGTAWTARSSPDTLTQTSAGDWIWRRAEDDSTYSFDGSGKLQTVVQRNGLTTVYTYNGAGQLATVANAFGASLTFGYRGSMLGTVTTGDGRTVSYTYDGSGRLLTVTYPDLKSKAYLYENAALPHALTGILDEAGQRYATIEYDATTGRAITTQLADGALKYRVSSSPGYAAVTDPLGTERRFRYGTAQGYTAVIGSNYPSADGGGAEASSRTLDANGLVTRETDFKDVLTTKGWDVQRRLPTSLTRAAGTAVAQTVSTQWHPVFALPVLVSEAGRSTAYDYDARGNMLSRSVTDSTVTPNSVKTWQWTYTAQGLVATETAPNGGVMSFSYDPFGNLTQSINAVGHVTQYTYDTANRLRSMVAANGLVTEFTYDARGRVLTKTVGGETTTLSYTPYGEIRTVALPTGLGLIYTYDAAHRLTGWTNNRGESGTFTLDGLGNRTAEQIKDAAGNVAWTVLRTYNHLSRLASETYGADLKASYGYDSNGDHQHTRDALERYTTYYERDALGRITADWPNSSIARLSYNALDSVTEATDFKGVVTSYGRDAQGNATVESSADTSSASTQYDALGLPSRIVDALGQATEITRDRLGRPTTLLFADGKTTTLRYDLSPNSKGYLSEIVDRSGTTEYTRDHFGRVTLKKQTLANGSVQQVSYGYNANGLLATIGYPDGSVLSHAYDATGRLTAMSLNGKPLVTGIAWNPLGQPTAWRWAFAGPALPASRTYDTAGRLTATDFSSYVYNPAGRISSLTQRVYRPDGSNPEHASISAADVTWSVGYNAVGGITSFNAGTNTQSLNLDPNGNRISSTRLVDGKTTYRAFSFETGTNRPTGFTQTIDNTSSTSVVYGYNANGDLTSDGLRSYVYDAEGRLAAATTGANDVSPTTRYAHNALGQRVFKTEPLYPPVQEGEEDPGVMRRFASFFTKLWSPATTEAEQLGYAYVYDEQGTLLAETGGGGARSGGQTQYIYLPTASGPMPIATVINGSTYAVHSDHLNTPRLLTNYSNQPVWQWTYSAFGEDPPTLARYRFAVLDKAPNPGTTGMSELRFNLRYPGQYADEESGLFYNYFRSYDSRTGRYTQPDPIGLDGGWNRLIYVDADPLNGFDPTGLRKYYDFDLRAPVTYDTGSSCKVVDGPEMDPSGCVSTGGGPRICMGPGAMKGAGLPVPQVADPKLGNLVKDLFKGARMPAPIGTGSTADAIRNELASGLPTAGKFHSQKGSEYARALENWLQKNPNASNYDRLAAESLKNDLLNAIRGR